MLDLAGIGQRVRESREKVGLTRQELAERLEISTYYVGQIERGERMMSLSVLEALASCLHVSLDYLVWGKERMDNCFYQLAESKGYYETGSDKELLELLDLCSPRERELIKKLIKVVLPYLR
ncbi:Helix-turn-helix domain-containing protein [Thermosyntropha lipolytica DSM 11003]|uniref:Helix-turn-helix domain-containing protein n=1 Tax=Thermosyntropha lipolytica DSM 11003 TaxID=1123382 RepID=A0A1M5NS13_9FIRM|nr:helix-turn-helix transcriptional regulator [Thermosyntropha lipolytica]SHG92290.1 Helix-turn-helix domain-containing protein [Thermosyntropha lipolytica DSM 11003]